MNVLVLCVLALVPQDSGSIEVVCDPGIEVFLDDRSTGTTGPGPHVVSSVSPGRHKLKLVKEGYQPREIEVVVESGKKSTVKAEPLRPDVKISEYDEEPRYPLKDKTGWIVVTTEPASCEISCPPLGIEKAKKTQARWSAFHIPPGRHTWKFTSGTKSVDHDIECKPGLKTFLTVYVDEARVAVDQGSILVKCEAGVEIRVDGKVSGTTTQDGLLVRDVPPGRHKITAKKFGYQPVEESANVEKGATAEVRVSTSYLKPEVLIFEEGKEPEPSIKDKMWKLVVRSLPVECSVSCSDLDLEKSEKKTARWTAYGVVEKRLSFKFATAAESVYGDVKPTVGRTTVVMVYFKDRRIEVDKGDVLVKTEPEVVVFVDGTEKGKTTPADGGLIVRDLTPGRHALKIAKPDFRPQETSVEVVAGEVTEWACLPLVPILQITEKEEEADPKFASKATLFLRTVPDECTIDCAPLGLEKAAKSAGTWIAYGIPAGSYDLTFTSGGMQIKHRAEFKAGRRVRVHVDFSSGTVTPIPPSGADFVLISQHRVHEKAVLSARYFPNARLAVSAGLDPWIRLWNPETRMEFDTFPLEEPALDFALSGDGKSFYILHANHIQVWDLLKRKCVRRVERPAGERALRIVAAGTSVALAIYGDRPNRHALVLVDPTTWKDILSIPVKEVLSEVDCLALSPDGQMIAWTQHESKIRLWGADGKEGRKILSFHQGNVRGLVFSADGKSLASFADDPHIRVWDPRTGRSVLTLDSKTKPESVAWSPDGKCIAAGDVFGAIRIWSLPDRKMARMFQDYAADVRTMEFSPDGKTLLTGGMIERRSDACPRGYGISFYQMME